LKYRGVGKGAHLLSSPNENSRIQITTTKKFKPYIWRNVLEGSEIYQSQEHELVLSMED